MVTDNIVYKSKIIRIKQGLNYIAYIVNSLVVFKILNQSILWYRVYQMSTDLLFIILSLLAATGKIDLF